MSARYSTVARNAMATGLLGVIDGGAAAGSAQFWSGAEPAGIADAPAGTLMATIGLAYPCGTVVDGVLLLSTTTPDPAVAVGGTPTFARFLNSAGTVVAILPVMLAANYDVLDVDAQTALGPIIRLTYALTAGQQIDFAGTLPFVMPGA